MTTLAEKLKGGSNVTLAQKLSQPPIPQQSLSDSIWANLAKTMGGAAKGGVEQVKKGFKEAQLGNNPLTAFKGATNIAAGAINTIASPLAPIFEPVGKGIDSVANKISDIPAVQNFANSKAGQVTADVAEITGNLSTIAGGVVAAEGLLRTGTNVTENISNKRAVAKTASEQAKIQETISPKATAKEAKLAQTQGRFVPGKEPTLLRAGKADTILPSEKVIRASKTIQKEIPNAAKLDDTQLYSALDKKIQETATKLRPQLESTPIKPETIQALNDEWTGIKKAQIADAPATEEPNVFKRQAKFEEFLKKSGDGSHADLWDTRIAYDSSISDAVKKANSLSSESLQLQKEEWLQNRSILNKAIDSQPEFKTMSDMYNAKEGILSKTKVDKAKISKVNQFLKDNPKVAAALGGLTIYEIAKKLGLPIP